MTATANITPLHVERGRQMRTLVQHDMTHRGLSLEASVESLAAYLGISVEAVALGIAIANGSEDGTLSAIELGLGGVA